MPRKPAASTPAPAVTPPSRSAARRTAVQAPPPPERKLDIRHSKGEKKWSSLRVITPVGTAAWPWLNSPKTTFDPNGAYEVDVVLTPDEVADFQADLQELADAYQEKYGKQKFVVLPIKKQIIRLPDGSDQETGMMVIKTKLKARQDKGDGTFVTQRPKIVDAKKNPMVPVPRIGGGTKLRVACDAVARIFVKEDFSRLDANGQPAKIPILYVSLTMAVVQVLNLVLFDTASPESYGMDEVEGYDFTAVEGGLEGSAEQGDQPAY